MAYYTALISAWNTSSASAGVLPNGVVGTSLFGLTTDQKIAAVNGWTVTGTVPSTFFVSGSQILNCIDKTEFLALTAPQQQNMLLLCGCPGQLLGGQGNTSKLVDGLIITYFPLAGPTVAALTALANAQIQPWWAVSVANGGGGLSGIVSQSDVTSAGVA